MESADQRKKKGAMLRNGFTLGKRPVREDTWTFQYELTVPVSGCLFSERGKFESTEIVLTFVVECESQEGSSQQMANIYPQTYAQWSESMLEERDLRWSGGEAVRRPRLRAPVDTGAVRAQTLPFRLKASLTVDVSADDAIQAPKLDPRVESLQNQWQSYLASQEGASFSQPKLLETKAQDIQSIKSLVAHCSDSQDATKIRDEDAAQISQARQTHNFAHDVYVSDQYRRCGLQPTGSATEYVGKAWAERLLRSRE